MKKIIISTSFILLAFTPLIFGNHFWNQDFNLNNDNSDGDILNGEIPQLANCSVFEDAILLINDETSIANYHDLEEIELEEWNESNFLSILTQRPNKEENKLLSQQNNFRDFTTLKLRTAIENGEIKLFDQLGKLACQQKISGHEFELKRNDLNTGIYFYTISENGNAINSGRIMVN
ncbi:MAG: T9SS type A sorting domain-containing protein [Saprospiraceae bacterium]